MMYLLCHFEGGALLLQLSRIALKLQNIQVSGFIMCQCLLHIKLGM